MSKNALLAHLREFGEVRAEDGDEFDEMEGLPGYFFYSTGNARTGIAVYGPDDRWSLNIFSAARVNMRPTLGLHEYISRWRTVVTIGAPYVLLGQPHAAVMCEGAVGATQLADDLSARRLINSTIDIVGSLAQEISADLFNADGIPFTARGRTGMTLLLSWWEPQDERVKGLLGL